MLKQELWSAVEFSQEIIDLIKQKQTESKHKLSKSWGNRDETYLRLLKEIVDVILKKPTSK